MARFELDERYIEEIREPGRPGHQQGFVPFITAPKVSMMPKIDTLIVL
jgi:hypothetical protein